MATAKSSCGNNLSGHYTGIACVQYPIGSKRTIDDGFYREPAHLAPMCISLQKMSNDIATEWEEKGYCEGHRGRLHIVTVQCSLYYITVSWEANMGGGHSKQPKSK